jgi:sugar phosphate permease
MWVCGILQFIRFGTIQGITYWIPSLLISEKGLSLQYTGFIVAVQVVLIAASNVLGGYVSDRLRNPILVIDVSLIVLGITTVLLVRSSVTSLTIVMVLVNGAFLQMYFGPLFSLPVDILGARKAGISTGFSNFFASVGGFSATYLLGALKDTTGTFRYGFYVIAGACFIGLIFTILLAKWRQKAIVSDEP